MNAPAFPDPSRPPRLARSPAMGWSSLTVFGGIILSVVACGPAGSKPVVAVPLAPAEIQLPDQLKPAWTVAPAVAASLSVPTVAWNPVTIFAVPFRSWLGPAEGFEKASILPGDLRLPAEPPYQLAEAILAAPNVTAPQPLVLPAKDLASAVGPDVERVTVWIATTPAPETRGRPPGWDRPVLASDPTAEILRGTPISAVTGLRETPPPFVRVVIPDPFEQIKLGELAVPPVEVDPPIAPYVRPGNPMPAVAVGK